ncbi:(2Fe-2S)-binding protein [Poseidonocella sp. HB161398]|uniref:(2Fe-2S)-binding protein n=1 Tax=Poseidonocella sp. HB161398 TaxID=2320855 RepID=UPI001F0E9672|nr:(2Fe-2S)-binding protein [Poseidonocella sp. HB161398]
MSPQSVSFTLNGRPVTAETDRHRVFLDLLRGELGLKGPKYGCGMAQCGACSILVDGRPARACVLRAARVEGADVVTLEGLAGPDGLHPVQQAFVEAQAAQCGYCLNGMVISAVALLRANPRPSRDEIRQGMRDNLCRCGTHQEIIEAVERAAELLAAAGGTAHV